MGSGFSVNVDAGELRKRIDAFLERGKDLSPIMAVIAEDLVAAVNDEFESEGHGKWPPHAASTFNRRKGGVVRELAQQHDGPMRMDELAAWVAKSQGLRRGSAGKLLQDTGVLAGSIEAHSGPDFAEASTGVSYVVYHLEGGPIIPRRNPFDVPDDVYEQAEQALLDYIVVSA